VHVLIVEDKKSLALMLQKGLQETNDSAVIAFDGLTGLMHAESEQFDAIVLDLMLPGMDGFEIVRRLRTSKNRVPVLVLTARDTVHDIVSTLDLGVDDYLTKPFAMAEFRARLRAVVRRGPAIQGVRLEVADLVLDPASGEVTRGGTLIALTRTDTRLTATSFFVGSSRMIAIIPSWFPRLMILSSAVLTVLLHITEGC
jgi:DNA-binding response OmpR family regulator